MLLIHLDALRIINSDYMKRRNLYISDEKEKIIDEAIKLSDGKKSLSQIVLEALENENNF